MTLEIDGEPRFAEFLNECSQTLRPPANSGPQLRSANEFNTGLFKNFFNGFNCFDIASRYFIAEHVQKDIPPKPQSISDCQALFQRSVAGKTLEASSEALDLIRQLKALESQTHAEEEQIDTIKQTLMKHMANAEVLTYLGKPVITWKAPKLSYRIDTKRLTLEHPELVKAYQSPIQSSRRFVVKDLPEELMPHELIPRGKACDGVAL